MPDTDANSLKRQSPGKTPTVESVKFMDQILSCFSVDTSHLGVAQIARLLCSPKARVHRFLISMEQIGYVQRDPGSERYSLGMRLYTLGMLAVNSASYLERIGVRAQELSEYYGYTAVVGILTDNEFVAVRTFMPARSLALTIHAGFRSPAYATAQGRVSLAFLSEDKLDAYLRTTTLRALTPKTLTNPDALRTELAAIRKQLFAIACDQTALGATAIAAPVFSIQGQVLATISLVWFTTELESRAEELGVALRDAGLQISAESGFRPPQDYHDLKHAE